MGLRRQRQCIAAWIACLAIMMAALAPSVSHILVSAGKSGGGIWADICSVAGKKLIQVSGARSHDHDSGDADGDGMHMKHCPYCRVHLDGIDLPKPPALAALSGAASFPVPLLFYRSPRPLFAWTAALSRGPPALS